jgi:hypothetical protein
VIHVLWEHRSYALNFPGSAFDLRGGTMTDIGNRAVEDFAVSAIRLAQQMPRIRFATTGDMRGIDIHSGYYNSIFIEFKQELFSL